MSKRSRWPAPGNGSSPRCALSATTSLANAIAMFAVVAYALFFIAAFALPETRGRVLHAD